MKIPVFKHSDKHGLRGKRRGALFAALCACAVAALALAALLPGEGLPRRVKNELYDEGAFAYTGILRGGRFSGQGRIEFTNGDFYEGRFAEGRFEGQGVFASADGWVFEGAFSEGKPLHGIFRTDEGEIEADSESNIYQVKDAWRYTGLLGVQGPRGQGLFVFSDGAEYRGEFRNGLPGGEGIYTDAAGTVIYTGEWQAGLFDGEGEYRAPDGAFTYKGSFAGGRLHGEGTLTRGDGTALSGRWQGGWRIKRED